MVSNGDLFALVMVLVVVAAFTLVVNLLLIVRVGRLERTVHKRKIPPQTSYRVGGPLGQHPKPTPTPNNAPVQSQGRLCARCGTVPNPTCSHVACPHKGFGVQMREEKPPGMVLQCLGCKQPADPACNDPLCPMPAGWSEMLLGQKGNARAY